MIWFYEWRRNAKRDLRMEPVQCTWCPEVTWASLSLRKQIKVMPGCLLGFSFESTKKFTTVSLCKVQDLYFFFCWVWGFCFCFVWFFPCFNFSSFPNVLNMMFDNPSPPPPNPGAETFSGGLILLFCFTKGLLGCSSLVVVGLCCEGALQELEV